MRYRTHSCYRFVKMASFDDTTSIKRICKLLQDTKACIDNLEAEDAYLRSKQLNLKGTNNEIVASEKEFLQRIYNNPRVSLRLEQAIKSLGKTTVW